jgi:enoyl-CoA hydratase
MEREPVVARRGLIKGAATIPAMIPVAAMLTPAAAAETGQEAQPTTLAEAPLGPNTKLTIERRDQIALFGINRPYIRNRIDPDTFQALAKAYYDYDHDPSLRAAVLFGHGDNFSRGLDVDGFKPLVGTGKPWISGAGVIDPQAKRPPHLTKPLIIAVHGDTWNMGHELFLVADIRVAAANTNFGQDENTHARFPAGGATVRFVREAG